jgi:hypothetical protein
VRQATAEARAALPVCSVSQLSHARRSAWPREQSYMQAHAPGGWAGGPGRAAARHVPKRKDVAQAVPAALLGAQRLGRHAGGRVQQLALVNKGHLPARPYSLAARSPPGSRPCPAAACFENPAVQYRHLGCDVRNSSERRGSLHMHAPCRARTRLTTMWLHHATLSFASSPLCTPCAKYQGDALPLGALAHAGHTEPKSFLSYTQS